jgi:glycosyltransferase involved in cell wall biosynthesis
VPGLHPWKTAPEPITATILTQNSARKLAAVLEALSWCSEVVVLDTGSTDDTRGIAAGFANVSVHRHQGAFLGFGAMHRQATELARNDWILSIDSDEVVSAALAAEIQGLRLDRQTVYELPFDNYVSNRRITTCGWAGEHHRRLYHRRVTNFSADRLHEKVDACGLTVRRLRHPVRHYSYDSLDDFLRKMQAYTTLFAEQHCGRRSAGPIKAWSHGAWTFFRSYFLRRGILQGHVGFLVSAYCAHTAVWKYLKLAELNRQRAR